MNHEHFVIPKEIHEKILEKHPQFSYSLNPEEDQVIWAQFQFNGFDLALTLDCDGERHSIKFIVLREEV